MATRLAYYRADDMEPPLRILAGKSAFEHLQSRGLALDDFDVFVAAAGGTKFLMLGGLDRVLFSELARTRRQRPLHCVGASIGSFRLACLAARDSGAALERLAAAYLGVRDLRRARRRHLSHLARTLVGTVLGDDAARIVDHPAFRLHILTSRCRGLAASERPTLLVAGLGFAAAANFVSRRALGLQLTRVAFHSRGEPGPLSALTDFPTEHAALTAENLPSVLTASAAIPFLVRGVSIPGAKGPHRDAALTDYHPVLPFERSAGLVLYPHFHPHLVPGWFDRSLERRLARGNVLDRTVLLAPSESFIATLPSGRHPSRRDVTDFTDDERRRRWTAVWNAGTTLGDALAEILASPRRARDALAPLP